MEKFMLWFAALELATEDNNQDKSYLDVAFVLIWDQINCSQV